MARRVPRHVDDLEPQAERFEVRRIAASERVSAARNPLAVFALDAIGAGFGAIAASLVPITFGLGAFFYLSGAVFLITVAANTLFHRRLQNGRP